MLTMPTSVSPLQILLQILFKRYLASSYCLTIVTETAFDIHFTVPLMYVNAKGSEDLVWKLLEASEKGCSDYIVQLKEPHIFMTAFERVNYIGNLRKSDRKIIFIPYLDDSSDERVKYLNVVTMKELKFVANVLIVAPSTNKGSVCVYYDLITHNFEADDAEINVSVYLDTWNSCTAQFNNNVDLFPHDLSNLHGKTLKLSCFTYKPFVLLDLDTHLAPSGQDGIELRLFAEFCRWVNCSIEIVRDDVKHQWGEIYENLTGVGIMGNVVEDRADIGINILVEGVLQPINIGIMVLAALYSWYEQYWALDYSAPYVRTAVTCLAPAPRILASWYLPLLPFSLYTWLGLVFTFISASVALALAKKNTDSVCFTTFGMMVTQSQNNVGYTWRVRSVTVWMLITGLVIDNAYSSGLASSFTVPTFEKSIDTIQDLVDKKMEWGATHDAWIYSIMLSPDPLIKQLVKQFRIYNAEVLKEKSFTRNMAFSIEILPAGYFAIGEYITKEAVLDLELMLEKFYYEQCVAMLRKSSPYTKKISKLVGRLHASGLILAWETQVALKYMDYKVELQVKLSRTKRDVNNTKPLALRNVVGIFVIYLIGTVISIIMFIAEITKKKKNVGVM